MLITSSKQAGSMETYVLLRFHECFQNLVMTRAALLLMVTILTLVVDEAQGSWRLIAAGSQPLESFWIAFFFCGHFSPALSYHTGCIHAEHRACG